MCVGVLICWSLAAHPPTGNMQKMSKSQKAINCMRNCAHFSTKASSIFSLSETPLFLTDVHTFILSHFFKRQLCVFFFFCCDARECCKIVFYAYAGPVSLIVFVSRAFFASVDFEKKFSNKNVCKNCNTALQS